MEKDLHSAFDDRLKKAAEATLEKAPIDAWPPIAAALEKKRKKRIGIWYWLSGGITVLAIGVGLYFYNAPNATSDAYIVAKNSNTNSSEKNTATLKTENKTANNKDVTPTPKEVINNSNAGTSNNNVNENALTYNDALNNNFSNSNKKVNNNYFTNTINNKVNSSIYTKKTQAYSRNKKQVKNTAKKIKDFSNEAIAIIENKFAPQVDEEITKKPLDKNFIVNTSKEQQTELIVANSAEDSNANKIVATPINSANKMATEKIDTANKKQTIITSAKKIKLTQPKKWDLYATIGVQFTQLRNSVPTGAGFGDLSKSINNGNNPNYQLGAIAQTSGNLSERTPLTEAINKIHFGYGISAGIGIKKSINKALTLNLGIASQFFTHNYKVYNTNNNNAFNYNNTIFLAPIYDASQNSNVRYSFLPSFPNSNEKIKYTNYQINISAPIQLDFNIKGTRLFLSAGVAPEFYLKQNQLQLESTEGKLIDLKRNLRNFNLNASFGVGLKLGKQQNSQLSLQYFGKVFSLNNKLNNLQPLHVVGFGLQYQYTLKKGLFR
jgi:hypothetical protein